MLTLCAPSNLSCHAEAFISEFLIGLHGTGLLLAAVLALGLACVIASVQTRLWP